jgi:hypothetical protein
MNQAITVVLFALLYGGGAITTNLNAGVSGTTIVARLYGICLLAYNDFSGCATRHGYCFNLFAASVSRRSYSLSKNLYARRKSRRRASKMAVRRLRARLESISLKIAS